MKRPHVAPIIIATLVGALPVTFRLGAVALAVPAEPEESTQNAPRAEPSPEPRETPASDQSHNVPLVIPLLDMPFNFANSSAFPSMGQSLGVTKDFYQLTHYGLGRLLHMEEPGWHRALGALAIAGFDALTYPLPLASAWMHEEWHRAVMAKKGISSHNDVYDFHLAGSIIAVSHETDAALTTLKQDSPADLVRLEEAGMESELTLAVALEKDRFFLGTRTFNTPVLYLLTLGPILYRNTCAGPAANTTTDAQNASDGTNVGKRDFAGLDCTAWAYDLNRPFEPYAARGPHPSGVGINRYRKWSDLNGEEQRNLVRMRNFGLLNLVDPFLAGISAFRGSVLPFVDDDAGTFLWNAGLKHHLTSFGHTIDLNLFFAQADLRLFATVHNFMNHDRYFPGLDVEWQRAPIGALLGSPLSLTTRVAGWLQPRAQGFRTTESETGGLLSAELAYEWERWFAPTLTLEGKTAGWVAGNVYLGNALSARLGVSALLF